MTSPWTIHGGRLAEARAVHGDGPWLDLSTGINPHAWPADHLLPTDWRALPDETALAKLTVAAAAYFGTNPTNVCAVPGSEIGLRLVGRLLAGPAVYGEPCYGTYSEMFEDGHAVAAASIATASGTIIIANPNNPDGRVTEPNDLMNRLEGPGWLLVDEAFADTMPEISLAGAISDDTKLVIFRSFGKFFGLAGLRLGFVIGPHALIASLRDILGSWPIASAAIEIGTAAYRDTGWITAMRHRLRDDAAVLDRLLARRGLDARGACPLFRLIETPDAAALFDRLARKAILTRPFAANPCWLRLGLPGSAEALERLDEALGDG